jgi:hypothetical protein|tara:strand:+ start:1077 stop:1241 length:165 start_codon:yes stop_codon:yes gene_type:complete
MEYMYLVIQKRGRYVTKKGTKLPEGSHTPHPPRYMGRKKRKGGMVSRETVVRMK